jgi:homoserine O-acetyltransferase/O-succinyltransferase
MHKLILTLLALLIATPAIAAPWPTQAGDVALKDFRFQSGESLASLRIHYTTLGSPHRGADGQIDNAIMVLHGTGGMGAQFLQPQFAEELYGPGQSLDITRYYIILPDSIGHGQSAKPSDGMRMAFPKYDYDDMVAAQYRMLTEGLGVKRLKLILGTSMGCMHSFVWGETYPGFAERLAPFACLPAEIAGRNRMWRKMAIDAVKADPAWQGGNYSSPPVQGMRTMASLQLVAGLNPLAAQADYPTREKAEAYLDTALQRGITNRDANDAIYQTDASRHYNPWPGLEKITVPVLWINSGDDFINPSDFGMAAPAVKRMKQARFILIPATTQTKGHGTHTWAKFWKDDLAKFMATKAR